MKTDTSTNVLKLDTAVTQQDVFYNHIFAVKREREKRERQKEIFFCRAHLRGILVSLESYFLGKTLSAP